MSQQVTIVQKYGGATLANPELIKQVAQRIAEQYRSGKKIVAVVSAMGKTTNELIKMAQSISSKPQRRELDMLLTTGERVSMSLLSMALHDLGIPAISYTGSQAGILTDSSHVNAMIEDVRAFRVQEALNNNKLVVLAGFQGVCSTSKEITTLGRGGTDTSAVAIASYLQATQCEILKDVDGVYSADPKLAPNAKPIALMHYKHLLEMTFWGAKVLHYRSVELANHSKIKLFIGLAANSKSTGTWVTQENPFMLESQKVLAINSHEQVLQLKVQAEDLASASQLLSDTFQKSEIAGHQPLMWEVKDNNFYTFLTAPEEVIKRIQNEFKNSSATVYVNNDQLCSVSLTCTGSTSNQVLQNCLDSLKKNKIQVHAVYNGAMSLAVFVDAKNRNSAIQSLSDLIST